MTAVEQRKAIVSWLAARNKRFRYSNDWALKFTPDRSGASDCSGVVYAAYQTIGRTIGKMSYDQAVNGTTVASYSGGASGAVAAFQRIQHLLKPGDIIAYALNYGYGGGTRYNHVDVWAGAGNYAWDHGGPGAGPEYLPVTDKWLLPKATKWTVRRIIQDDTTPEEIEEVKTMGTEFVTFTLSDGKTRCIANIGAGTWTRMPNVPTMQDRLTVLRVCERKVLEWSERPGGKTSIVNNPAAFGQEVPA